MKQFAVIDTFHNLSSVLSEDKAYEILSKDKYSFRIKNDEGEHIYCLYFGCAHLQGGNWKIINHDEIVERQTEI